jgi:hypothetical protein
VRNLAQLGRAALGWYQAGLIIACGNRVVVIWWPINVVYEDAKRFMDGR